MRIDVSMIGPSGAGKTSMLTAIFMDAKRKLIGHSSRININPDGNITVANIKNAISKFEQTISLESNTVTTIAGSGTKIEYKFRFSIPNAPQPVDVKILDYPGGWLGTEKYAEVENHIYGSSAMLIPIPADVLLELKRLKGQNSAMYYEAEKILDIKNVKSSVLSWLSQRMKKEQKSLLIFVPIRCEHCFDDNGGNRDLSANLHDAVNVFYVNEFAFTEEQSKFLKIEVHAIDTYGVVELKDINWTNSPNGHAMLSNFVLRKNGTEIKAKGAYGILSSIIHFRLLEYAEKQGISIGELEEKIRNTGLFQKIKILLFGDSRKKELIALQEAENAAILAMDILKNVDAQSNAKRRKDII